jgi:hypothetical protein
MLRQEVREQDKGCDKGSKNKKRDKKSAEKKEMKGRMIQKGGEGRRQHRQSEKNKDSLDRS